MIALRLPTAALILAALAAAPAALGASGPGNPDPQYRWKHTPHAPMLERLLPPAITAAQLPEPQSDGARLTVKYCVQCHYLASPGMHPAERWPLVTDRMVWRMEGNGNLGTLMKELMAGVVAPTAGEKATLVAYLQRHALTPIDSARYPDLAQPEGRAFEIACSQCHAAPDPKMHTSREWPKVVERMQRHMGWANRVVGEPKQRTHPVLDTKAILRFLQRHARTA